MKRYKVYIILNPNPYQLEFKCGEEFEPNTCSRAEAEEMLRGLHKAESGWFILADGQMIAIPEGRMSSVHFAAAPVEEDN